MMQLLLDTNIVLWLAEDNPKINQIKPLLLSEESQVFISTASWWEILIKVRANKLDVNLKKLRFSAKEAGFLELPISSDYLNAYFELPKLHKDPFDHMLLAQAISCPMRLITGDSRLTEYSSLVMLIDERS
ncbi:MAG: type II toxin-antitoxin system VapC family toxin [Treponema sp.]|jgi:PIN domain nuclease of toxin-antitoxin system|nr:type II toxin-antitoxin system VapC family toxin [Treponema sp.]